MSSENGSEHSANASSVISISPAFLTSNDLISELCKDQGGDIIKLHLVRGRDIFKIPSIHWHRRACLKKRDDGGSGLFRGGTESCQTTLSRKSVPIEAQTTNPFRTGIYFVCDGVSLSQNITIQATILVFKTMDGNKSGPEIYPDSPMPSYHPPSPGPDIGTTMLASKNAVETIVVLDYSEEAWKVAREAPCTVLLCTLDDLVEKIRAHRGPDHHSGNRSVSSRATSPIPHRPINRTY
ncbi:1104_t:CDS:2 [Paraglomus brasilianum]|uniref:1104_t:CDS:1 n=1 Tax=Paraglomus brasilianum TaxID=144538 RepID=A0A9N9B5Z6_9GLOM|nr:1104_t:CDS:2 [Paraglomus brasilianum]